MWFTCNTQEQACVFAQVHMVACGEQSSHMHAHRCVCTGPPWLLCGHVQAGAWFILGIDCLPYPSAESARGQVGPGGAETSPSCCAQFQGSHPLASCPQSLPALAPGRPQEAQPPAVACLSPPPRPTQCRGCATHFLPTFRAPHSQNQRRTQQSGLCRCSQGICT